MYPEQTSHWIISILMCIIAASSENITLIEGPKDTAALSGQNATLICHVNTTASGSGHVVQWVGNSYRTGLGRPLSVNDRITITGAPNKFSISSLKPYNLHLQNTDLDDAGKYTCNNVLIGSPVGGLEPQLVVLDPEPCPMSANTTSRENDTIKITWSVKYAGNRNDSQKPTIRWTLNGIQQTATVNETTPGDFSSSFTRSASSDDDQMELNCSLSVLNIQEHCSTKLDIQYPARMPVLFENGKNIRDQHNSKHTIGKML
ncbi:unnamed protein product [Owenia fusiformis]|uniref:Ig-like domain-containing protein n=1 Tax=Owenia fusiformis TaxID=6347 RepID=A0A8S4Q972_OWEFU|nr:unnamed protein product [Owenia fusiformis]